MAQDEWREVENARRGLCRVLGLGAGYGGSKCAMGSRNVRRGFVVGARHSRQGQGSGGCQVPVVGDDTISALADLGEPRPFRSRATDGERSPRERGLRNLGGSSSGEMQENVGVSQAGGWNGGRSLICREALG